ncbi:MAG: ABC transporter substrate-binding protein [SAR324 cluster bacterium]|nr:ABC transporter substrate-binding protein [SAR324 cluster bacterium]
MASSDIQHRLTACRDLSYSYVQQLLQLHRGVGWRQWSRNLAIALLLLGALLPPNGAWALDHGRPVNIGALTTSWGPPPYVVGLRDGLVALGYRENEHFAIGTRFVSGKLAKLPGAAQELVEAGVDIIIAGGTPAVIAAQRITHSIPVVFVISVDPVKAGLVRSYSRPGGNITGVTGDHTSLGPKRLEIFKNMIPGLKNVMFVYDIREFGSAIQATSYRDTARLLGIDIVEHAVRTESEANAAFAGFEKGQVDGILAPYTPSMNIPGIAAKAATQKRIPAMFPYAFWVERGGLASYGPNLYSMGQQVARMVDKIMRGVKPAEIPVEVNNDIEFAVNLKTAKALGIKIPPEVLYQANRIVR